MSDPKLDKFCWNELMTSDVDGATNFYNDLFGWTKTDMDMGDQTYSIFQDPNGPEGPEGMVGGMMQAPTPKIPSHWMSYIMVDDVAATLEKAKSLGAEILTEFTELPMGDFGVIKDPQGAVFGLWKDRKEC